MREMKRVRFKAVIEIPADTFAGEFDLETASLLYYAFVHGDGSGDFYTYCDGDVTVEDYLEESA